jgi:hypothetical protein
MQGRIVFITGEYESGIIKSLFDEFQKLCKTGIIYCGNIKNNFEVSTT